MEKLILRYQSFSKALKTLDRVLKKINIKNQNNIEVYEELRDSAIKRFEYCADTFWKLLKDYLRIVYKNETIIARPKEIYKECQEVKLLNPAEFDLCVDLLESRNLTSHTYNEETAEEINTKIPEYFELMNKINNKIKTELNLPQII